MSDKTLNTLPLGIFTSYFLPVAKAYKDIDPRDVPMYGATEIAHTIGLSPSTVRAWLFGGSGTAKAFAPVVRPADPKNRRASFRNVVEIHMLMALRRVHKVRLDKIRKANDYLQRKLGVRQPLASGEMLTDGVDIFVDRYGQLLNVSQDGQRAIRQALADHLERIERDSKEDPVRLFPFTREGKSPKMIAIDPRRRFGQPYLVDCGAESGIVFGRHLAGESVRSLALEFRGTTQEIEEAIRFHARAAA